MSANSPFSISTELITSLSPDRSVDFFRRLLWAEAGRVGIGKDLIHVPDCINIPDGGIDALIEDAAPSSQDIIPNGSSGFQVKLSNLKPSKCRKELHIGNKITRPIKPEIKRLLDTGGTYVLVLFADISVPMRRDRIKAIKDELKKLGYPGAQIRLYDATQLIGFAENFISLVTYIESELIQCIPYTTWSKHRGVITPRDFFSDKNREIIIKNIRDSLRNPGAKTPILRITGLPGIGKTRLVYEALSPHDLSNRVVYIESAEGFLFSGLYNTIQNDDHISAILVIDDCSLENHDRLVRTLSGLGLAQNFLIYKKRPSDLGINEDALHTQVKNTFSKLGITTTPPRRVDPINEILSKRYDTPSSTDWRSLLESEYTYAAGILSQADVILLSGPSQWISLQNSFNHALFIALQNYLKRNCLPGVVRTINRKGELISFGVNLDRNNSFSRRYPDIADAFRQLNGRRNNLPFSHPYDTKTFSRNEYLKPQERNRLVAKLKIAYSQLAGLFS